MNNICWKKVLRDALITWLLTMAGGFVIGFGYALSGSPDILNEQMLIGLSNIACTLGGFTVSACLAGPGRFRHLTPVALLLWLSGLLNVALFGFPLAQWAGSIVLIFALMGLGGALSYLFVPPQDSRP